MVRVNLGIMVEKGALHSPDLQNWRLSLRYSLMPYPGHPLSLGGEAVSYSSVRYTDSVFLATPRVGPVNSVEP